jgi:hypothetical protein
MSSQAIWARANGGPGALLVSLFDVKWRFSAPAGGVEGSKFCLFSVVLPAKCVSSISPRFHYRRLAFCFLPLAAILESLNFFKRPFLFLSLYHGFLFSSLRGFIKGFFQEGVIGDPDPSENCSS